MTEQYQVEDINGQPSALSLRVNPVTGPVAGVVNTEAIFWSSLAADSTIVGEGLSVAGDANEGSIIEISQPGLYEVNLWLSDDTPGPNEINILRGTTLAITAGNGYPAQDWLTGIPLGLEGIMWSPNTLPAPVSAYISATFRITGADLTDTNNVVNPNRQIRFSAAAAVIPLLLPETTLIQVSRVSL